MSTKSLLNTGLLGKKCHRCKKLNHFAAVCRTKQSGHGNKIIDSPSSGGMTSSNDGSELSKNDYGFEQNVDTDKLRTEKPEENEEYEVSCDELNSSVAEKVSNGRSDEISGKEKYENNETNKILPKNKRKSEIKADDSTTTDLTQ